MHFENEENREMTQDNTQWEAFSGTEQANTNQNGTGWNQQDWNNAGWQQSWQPPAAMPMPGGKKGGSKALGVASLVMACSLAGFGGGWLATEISASQPGHSVVYRAPEEVVEPVAQQPANYSVSDIASRAGKSVVSIEIEETARGTGGQRPVATGAGSGVIISEDGHIITNNHVVEGGSQLVVTLPDGTEHKATLVGRDPLTDVAVIKIEATGLTPAVFGDSDSIAVGDFCLAIGNPMGTLGGTVTDGIISALNRDITIDNTTMNLIQMSAAVSPGNSGGGLFDAKGQLVGVVNAKSGGQNVEGLGFAIPSNTAREIAVQLMEHGAVTGRPALGVSVFLAEDQQQADAAGFSGPGLYIGKVNFGSAAEKAGLQVGDRIVEVEGQAITTQQQLRSAIFEKKPGDTLSLLIERNGTQNQVDVVLGEMDSNT